MFLKDEHVHSVEEIALRNNFKKAQWLWELFT